MKRRFRASGAMTPRQRRLVRMAWGLWGASVLVFFIWIGGPGPTPKASLATAVTRSDNPGLHLWNSGVDWHQRPVFQLQDSGPALTRVNMYSWANHPLTVLYVGPVPPSDLSACAPLGDPPYTLPSGDSLWFVADADIGNPITVTWQDGGQTLYTTLTPTESPAVSPTAQGA